MSRDLLVRVNFLLTQLSDSGSLNSEDDAYTDGMVQRQLREMFSHHVIFTTLQLLMSIITIIICPFLLVKSWDTVFLAALSEAAAVSSKQDFGLLSFSSLSTVLHVP